MLTAIQAAGYQRHFVPQVKKRTATEYIVMIEPSWSDRVGMFHSLLSAPIFYTYPLLAAGRTE